LLVTGCYGSTAPTDESSSEASLKETAANKVAAGGVTEDPCATNGWYGDSVCDTFCFDTDADCQASGEPVYCAEFIEIEDGTCMRPETDPCRFQDPDCNVNAPTIPGDTDPPTNPDEPVACALYLELEDGKCSRPEDDACRFQDPDCADQREGYDCDTSKITCQTFAPVTCPDGQVPTVVDGCYGDCVDPAECAPVACLAYIEESDGACSRPENDPCKGQDPDCTDGGVACDAYVEESDGMCSRAKDDPCMFQDPDCGEGGGVVCAAYVEESDGVCKRSETDPCRSQDPDCISAY
jgi:hypothetical protein